MRELHERNRTLALMVMLGVLVTGGCAPPGPRETTGETGSQQPAQPPSGPGGSDYPHADMRVSSGGEGVYGWYVFEPIHPQPASAPLAIILHGYAEYSGYDMMYELIRHTVRKGNVVIYPRWQTGLAFPCAGAFDIEPCMTSARVGIQSGLELLNEPGRVRLQLERTSYFGFSFGGILTANLANRHASMGLPTPRAIFLEDPHDGGTDGEGGLDETLDGIPASVKLQCHSSEEGIISEKGKAHSSCNAVFPKLGHIPDENKDLVMIRTDRHGTPPLSSRHGVSAGGPGYGGRADAYDWNFVWKVWDALRSCAYDGTDCQYALGDTPEHRSLGVWSDGQPVIPLVIQDAAPLRP